MNAFWQSLLITPFLASIGCKSDGGLSAGDVAPDFLLKGSDGNSYQLSSYTGKKAVVLAWFPKAFTGGCTKQCKAIAESSAALKEFEAVYFTISCDPLEGKKGIVKFAESLSVDYPILSDSSKSVAEQYGVLGDVLPFPKRWTFYTYVCESECMLTYTYTPYDFLASLSLSLSLLLCLPGSL